MEEEYCVKNLLMVPLDNNNNYINISEEILDSLTKQKFKLPFYFKLSSNNGLYNYVGVKEFIAEPETLEVPSNIINYLGSEYGNISLVSNIPKGEFIKLKTNDNSFYNIHDYDKFLALELSKYCLLDINYNIKVNIMNKDYTFEIKEMKIKIDDNLVDYNLIDIVNVDLKVDFEKTKNKKLIKFDFGDNLKINKELNHFKKLKDKGNKKNYNIKNLDKNELRLQRLKYFNNKKNL